MIEPEQLPVEHWKWIDNEYTKWVEALNSCTVHNFKEHQMVKRMLGEPDYNLWEKEVHSPTLEEYDLLVKINNIGYANNRSTLQGASLRMIYYARQIITRNPSSICEIGGGVGQFWAILAALGYKGEYWIEDLPDVKVFQSNYLTEVYLKTGLNLGQSKKAKYDLIVSFYAFGEFDNKTKAEYADFINSTPHGYIAWNPHSGASDDLSLFKHDIKVTPGIEEGIKIIEW